MARRSCGCVVFAGLLPSLLWAQEAVGPVASPAAEFYVAAEVERGCAILLDMQEGDGRREWPYEGVYRTDEDGQRRVIPIGYRVGGTAIGALALLAAPGYDAADDPAAAERRAAVRRALEFVLEALALPLMQPSTEDRYDVRGWGHIYALQLLLRLRDLGGVPAGLAEPVDERVTWLVDALQASAIPRLGGWNYAGRQRPSPFMTAPALQALFWAAARGEAVDPAVVEAALDALERGRAAAGSIAYAVPAESRAEVAEAELAFMDLLPGSIGRMVCVEATLWAAGRGSQQRLGAAVDAFFEHWQALEARRKRSGTHVRPYGVAPYYFVFAHYHVAQAIELLDDPAVRDARRSALRELLANVREPDGGYNDRVFPRSRAYGTAMIMMALRMSELPRPERYGPGAK
ncbi:MAG: hypothetical protein IPM29_10715 [Planctomycetes bacterium]|nr:hypothetical protein [Planctomycetota bacterium]